MPTECERSVTSPTTVQGSATELKDNLTTLTGFNEHLTVDTMMEGDMSTSQTSTTSNGSSTYNGGRKTSITSPDPTAYVAKARVTRPTPPPPPYNPMQFVQIKPCNLYQTAQEQLKKAEEVKKIKEIRKEEPEDWQNNLDNWKSSRRKRVEHIIDRVVEVKKLELEEHDRTRRKSKTFSEMIEERGERSGGRGLNKLASLAVYAEDEANDLSDLGIGTSSASGKSSLSEDYDNNSVMSDNAAELDKAITNNTHNKPATTESTIREYIPSPGYETSSSTAPASSPDPCEYTYEGAIQDYKQRVSRAASGLTSVALNKLTTFNSQQQQLHSKESTPERPAIREASYPPRRGSKIEDRLMGFEVQSPSEECVEKNKVVVPKIDISKRKEIFEAQDNQNGELKSQQSSGGSNNTGVPRVTLRDRFKVQETTEILTEQPKKDMKRLSGDITSIKERLQSLEQQQNLVNGANGATKATANKLVDIPVPPLKERLSSLQNALTKEEVRKPPVKLVDARQLEIMKNEEEKAQQTLKVVKQAEMDKTEEMIKTPATNNSSEELEDVDRDDSGIHTADDVDLEERHQADIMKKEQELKLNAAIEALAKEEKQLSEAANAVNQIEAEFEELTLGTVSLPPLANNTNANATPITNEHMEYSINEALELALEAIDKETQPDLQQQQQQLPQQQPQPENLYPITAPYNNNDTTTTFAETIPNNDKTNENNSKEIVNETEIKQQNDLECLRQQEETLSPKDGVLKNKTDEEKFENLKLEENCSSCLEIQEKSEEEISKEPIYENINSTTSIKQVDVALTKMLTNTNTTTTTLTYQQQQQQQIIPSMMSKEQIDNFESKQNFNLQNNQINNLNQTQIKLSTSNQLKNSQINHFNCQISNNNNNNNNNNNSNSNNNISNISNNSNTNNIINNKNNNQINHDNNVVDLTNAFANTTITATTTTTMTTTTTISNDNPINQTNTAFKENNFHHHLEQPNIKITTSKSNSSKLTATKETDSNIFDNELNTAPLTDSNPEPYYQVPKSSEPYYDAPKHLKPIPVYENIEIFFNGNMNGELTQTLAGNLQPPKEKPPPPPLDSPPLFDDVDSSSHTDTWSSDNTYETLTRHHVNHHNQQHQQLQHHISPDQPSPPIKRMNSTKRIKKELRNKRSSFLGIEGSSLDDDESYLELTVAPPPDMAQLLQEERRLEKQLYLKAGLCDSSDTGESRDSGVSENHSRQSSEHYTNSSEENETHDDTTSPLTLQTQTSLDPTPNDMLYQNDGLLTVVPTPLLQTVKGNSAESWTESATVAAAATQSLTEATATANAKMMSIEEKIREQEEVLRVERELLQLEQEELKRQRENLMLRENMARRELQHGAKMLMSANRRSLQDLNGLGAMSVVNMGAETTNKLDMYQSQINHGHLAQHIISQPQLVPTQQQQQQNQQPQLTQQIYANIPNLQHQYYHMENDYRKSMSDINEFSKRMMSQPPAPPSKPMRAMHINTNAANGLLVNGEHNDFSARQRHSLNSQNYGGSLVKIAAAPTAAPRAGPHIYSNYHHQSVQNLSSTTTTTTNNNSAQPLNGNINQTSLYTGNMSRNTLHALSATPKPKYTDGWVQVQQRKSFDSNLANDPAWLSAYQQKRKSMPDTYHGYNQNNHWLIQEAEQRRFSEQHQQQTQRITISLNSTPVHPTHNKLTNGSSLLSSTTNGKPLPDSIIQTLTERVQSKGIGERKRNNLDKSPLHAASTYHQYQQQYNKLNQQPPVSKAALHRQNNLLSTSNGTAAPTNSSTPASYTATQGQSNIITAQQQQQQDKVLSVSGKKKCSHCGDELGRGAAMIIESLLLFYHINCFKCCVCHVQLGDGLNGTDVRVRNHKLHCQNCYSSDDGIKFSCV